MNKKRTKLIITIDTEADNQWDEDAGLEVRNLEFIPRFHALCRQHGLKVTYLCTYEVVKAPAFTDMLCAYEADGSAEIGAHLHPWSTPPFDGNPEIEVRSRMSPYALPPEAFRRKMETLTEAMAKRGNRAPVSYRAGRYGLAAGHIPTLLSLGYQVDCSVTPLVSWKHAGNDGDAPDFSRAPDSPYYLDPGDVCRPGGSRLLEVPITILYLNSLMRHPALRRGIARLRRRRFLYGATELFSLDPTPRWFRPLPGMSAEKLLRVYRTAVARGLPVVVLMFHSSELMPGGSPYNRTTADVEHLYRRLDTLFEALREGCESVTLSEFARDYRH